MRADKAGHAAVHVACGERDSTCTRERGTRNSAGACTEGKTQRRRDKEEGKERHRDKQEGKERHRDAETHNNTPDALAHNAVVHRRQRSAVKSCSPVRRRCMCACMCVRGCACMRACMCACMCASMCASMCACMCACLCASRHVFRREQREGGWRSQTEDREVQAWQGGAGTSIAGAADLVPLRVCQAVAQA